MNANAIPELLEWYLFLLFLIKKKKTTLNLNTYLVSDTWYGNNYLFAFKRGEHLLWYSEEIKKDHPCYFPKLIIFNHFDVSKRNKEQRMTRMQQTALLMPYELLSPERKSYSQFHENSCLEKQFPAYFVLAPFPTFCKQYVPRIMPAALGQYCFKASPAVPALRTPHHMVNQGMHSPKTNKETNKGFAGDIHRSNKVYLKKKKFWKKELIPAWISQYRGYSYFTTDQQSWGWYDASPFPLNKQGQQITADWSSISLHRTRPDIMSSQIVE